MSDGITVGTLVNIPMATCIYCEETSSAALLPDKQRNAMPQNEFHILFITRKRPATSMPEVKKGQIWTRSK